MKQEITMTKTKLANSFSGKAKRNGQIICIIQFK